MACPQFLAQLRYLIGIAKTVGHHLRAFCVQRAGDG